MTKVTCTVDTEAVESYPNLVFKTPRWVVKVSENQSNNLYTEVQELIDQRKQDKAHRRLCEYFIDKMHFRKLKDTSFDVTAILFEDSLLAMVQAWKDRVKLREKPKQKSLEEQI